MKVTMKSKIGVYVAALTLFISAEMAIAQQCVIGENGCLYGVEGACVPRRTTYGYYETHWRNWPFGKQPKIAAKRQRPTGSTALPEAEVPRPRDEAATNPQLPHIEEDLAPFTPGALPEQMDIDRQTNPFEDDLQTPAEEGPLNEDQFNPFEDDLKVPAVEAPDDAGAMRRLPSRFNPTRSAGKSVGDDKRERGHLQYGQNNPLRSSLKPRPGAVTDRLHAAQAVAFEELSVETPATRSAVRSRVTSPSPSAASNPLRR